MTTAVEPDPLTYRWTPLRYHEVQQAIWTCPARFVVALAGRRSGKSEVLAKRRTIRKAFECRRNDGWFWLFAPTHKMARAIFWNDLKAMIPRDLMAHKPYEAEMQIRLVHGPRIQCSGVDDPERMRGVWIDGCVLDEYDFMRDDVFDSHLRPALSTPSRDPGWAAFVGTPDGRGKLWRLFKHAIDQASIDWAGYRYSSYGIVSDEELAAARRDMDPRLFAQEFEAEAMLLSGRAYYNFAPETHADRPLPYDKRAALLVGFDFNVEPGVAVIAQEFREPNPTGDIISYKDVTHVIGEVWIPRNSNTQLVARKVAEQYRMHEGPVMLYGDATGGARKTTGLLGTDWDIIQQELYPIFRERLSVCVPRANPEEKARVNALNSRLISGDGIRLRIDPRCVRLIEDLEGVTFLEGGTGEIDKKANAMLTHLSDALGYLVEYRYPVQAPARRARVTQIY